MRFSALAAAAIAAAVVGQARAEELALTDATFDKHVGGDVPALVEFYAPWCGHCKALAPEWTKLSDTFKPSDGIVIAKVDADASRDLASRFGIQGFPTIKYFPKGSASDPVDYEGGRTADDLVAFVNSKTGLRKHIKTVPSAVVALDSSNFDEYAGDVRKGRFLEFYAPWCGHCKSLAPVYEKLGAVFEGEPGVLIAKIDADKNRDLGERFGVKGFPTIKFVAPGMPGKPEDSAEDYSGGRDLESMVNFINTRANTARSADGSLLPTAGRADKLDYLASKFMAGDATVRAEVLAEVELAASRLPAPENANARNYAGVMKKVIEKGEGYIATEAARVKSMVGNPSIAAAKRTELQMKHNVLAFFANPVLEK